MLGGAWIRLNLRSGLRSVSDQGGPRRGHGGSLDPSLSKTRFGTAVGMLRVARQVRPSGCWRGRDLRALA